MARTTRGKKSTVSINMEGVRSDGVVVPEDDYIVQVDEVEVRTSDDSGQDYLSFTFEISEGDHKGKKLYHNCSLQPQALFNLRGVLESLGMDVPDGPMDLDPADLVGLSCSVAVQHEDYKGKTKARIVEFRPEETEVAPPAKPTKSETAESAPQGKKTRKKKAPSIDVGSAVTFVDDDGNELSGKVTAIEDDQATVKVGKDEWELGLDELTLKD